MAAHLVAAWLQTAKQRQQQRHPRWVAHPPVQPCRLPGSQAPSCFWGQDSRSRFWIWPDSFNMLHKVTSNCTFKSSTALYASHARCLEVGPGPPTIWGLEWLLRPRQGGHWHGGKPLPRPLTPNPLSLDTHVLLRRVALKAGCRRKDNI